MNSLLHRTKCIAKYRCDDLSDLRDAIFKMVDRQVKPSECLPSQGPFTLNLIEEHLSDGSVVYNFGFSVMTTEQIRREAE